MKSVILAVGVLVVSAWGAAQAAPQLCERPCPSGCRGVLMSTDRCACECPQTTGKKPAGRSKKRSAQPPP